jgi:glutamate racemase
LIPKIRQYLPSNIQILSQGELVARSLVKYLKRHPEIDILCTKNGKYDYYTTESVIDFNNKAALFLGKTVESIHLHL